MELTVNNELSEREELKQFHPRKGYENLRFFIARDESQTDQFR